jgi:hypothetical protein
MRYVVESLAALARSVRLLLRGGAAILSPQGGTSHRRWSLFNDGPGTPLPVYQGEATRRLREINDILQFTIFSILVMWQAVHP